MNSGDLRSMRKVYRRSLNSSMDAFSAVIITPAAVVRLPRVLALVLSALSVFGIPVQGAVPKTPDIHFAVTPQPLADAMLTLARVTKDDVVYDLGSGTDVSWCSRRQQ